MSKPKILVQLDSDPHASVFDGVVAVDSGVDHLFRHHSVEAAQVRDLVHGTMFTRGPQDLRNTAVFVGGSDVAAGENLLKQVTNSFFGPMRVSVMMDANGANTTAAAAVLSAARHLDLKGTKSAVLAATGPVGARVVRLLARAGSQVHVGSRNMERADDVCQQIAGQVAGAALTPLATHQPGVLRAVLDDCQVVFAAGAFGIQLLPEDVWRESNLQVAIDMNAVPPVGIEGVDVMDSAAERHGALCYGAIGVGNLKMKIHKAAIKKLFESNDQVFDAEEIFAIGQELL